jgi:hypothetical protein
LHFFADGFNGGSNVQAISWLGSGTDILLEDLRIENYAGGISIQGTTVGISTGRPNNIVIRRCIVSDTYSNTDHAGGMFANYCDNLVVEECIFDKNGYKDDVAPATIFNHGFYLSVGNTNVVFRRNIVIDSASHGVQLRCGGVIQDNLFIRNAISILLGGGDPIVPGGATGEVIGNVILEGKDITTSAPRGYGIDLKNLRSAIVRDNIIANKRTTMPAFAIGVSVSGGPDGFGVHDTDISNNVVYRWNGPIYFKALTLPATYAGVVVRSNTVIDSNPLSVTPLASSIPIDEAQVRFTSNRYWSAGGDATWFRAGNQLMGYSQWTSLMNEPDAIRQNQEFVAPDRSLATFAASIGLAETHEAATAALKTQSRRSWNPQLSIDSLLTYFREGFTPRP